MAWTIPYSLICGWSTLPVRSSRLVDHPHINDYAWVQVLGRADPIPPQATSVRPIRSVGDVWKRGDTDPWPTQLIALPWSVGAVVFGEIPRENRHERPVSTDTGDEPLLTQRTETSTKGPSGCLEGPLPSTSVTGRDCFVVVIPRRLDASGVSSHDIRCPDRSRDNCIVKRILLGLQKLLPSSLAYSDRSSLHGSRWRC